MPDLPVFAPHYHVGIVVPEIHAARDRLSDLLGVRWGPVMHLDGIELRDGAGTDLVLPSTMCYSASDPALELIEEVPGSVWVTNEHSNLHHIGFWVDGFASVSGALAAASCPLQITGRSGADAPATFAYHRDPLGIRIELVDATMRDAMQTLFDPDL